MCTATPTLELPSSPFVVSFLGMRVSHVKLGGNEDLRLLLYARHLSRGPLRTPGSGGMHPKPAAGGWGPLFCLFMQPSPELWCSSGFRRGARPPPEAPVRAAAIHPGA